MKQFKPINSVTDMKTQQQLEFERNVFVNMSTQALNHVVGMVAAGKFKAENADDIINTATKFRAFLVAEK